MPSSDQKKKLLKAKIAVALHDELGRVPKTEEIDQVFLLARVMYKAVLGLHFQRQEQKNTSTTITNRYDVTVPRLERTWTNARIAVTALSCPIILSNTK